MATKGTVEPLPAVDAAQRARLDTSSASQLAALSGTASGKSPRGTCAILSAEKSEARTLAARMVAEDVRTPLYRLDVSRVVSKYLGETEKNLSRIFEEASATHATLLLDEADALFGERSEVRDSQDRHANADVAQLLRRIEQYPGLVLFSTTSRANIDPAVSARCSLIQPVTTR